MNGCAQKTRQEMLRTDHVERGHLVIDQDAHLFGAEPVGRDGVHVHDGAFARSGHRAGSRYGQGVLGLGGGRDQGAEPRRKRHHFQQRTAILHQFCIL